MFTISKEFHFSASHVLHGLAEGHPCGRMHGHNYVVAFKLASFELDDIGMVEDYGKLKDIKVYIDDVLDHRHLNDIIPGNPTAENIARFLYTEFKSLHPKLMSVEVRETPKTSAIFSQNEDA